MRVLATFPDLAEPTVAAEPVPASMAPADPVLPAASRPPGRRPIRRTHRARFPTGSIVALGLITAAIWALVASREAARPPRRPAAEAWLALEPAAAGEPESRR